MSDIRTEDYSAEAIAAKDRAVLKFLKEAGLQIEGQAAKALEMDPRRIDTGLLRNSITHALDGEATEKISYRADRPRRGSDTIETGSYSGTTPEEPQGSRAVYIGTNVEYAEYVHDGTSRMAPNRFLKNAVELNKGQLQDKLKEALENA